MLKKVFLLTQFGPPHEWAEQYLTHIRKFEEYGWYWKILTPHPYPSGGNVEIVPMTLDDFDARVTRATGVWPGNSLDERGLPRKLTSDYYPAFGHIFEDLVRGFDYWSATNWDVVYGRLDHFIPDRALCRYDIWSDDCHHINSLFCLYQNNQRINLLYQCVPGWQQMFEYKGIPIYGFDEGYFNDVVRELADKGELRFGHPPYFAYHSYDRLLQHQPFPNLTMAPDGALIEVFEDHAPQIQGYLPWRGYFGREIMYFHFIQSKRWPLLREYK